MIPDLGTVQRGETLSLSLGPRRPGETLTAALAPAAVGLSVPPPTVPRVPFAVTDGTTEGGDPVWTLTLTPAQTAALTPPVTYVLDGRITISPGVVQITEPARITVAEAVTQP